LEFEIKDKKNITNNHSPILSQSKLNINTLRFAQVKALKILTDYRITQELALEMINRALGSEIQGFEDWYFEEVIRIFERKTNQTTTTAKTGTLVNWFIKKKIFEQGDHFAVIMEQLQQRKKQLQSKNITAWENRLLAKTMSATGFRTLIQNQDSKR